MPPLRAALGLLILPASVVPQTARIVTSPYFPTAAETGTATDWASLPTARLVRFYVSGSESVLLLGSISGLQHASQNVHTVLRIVVDGSTVVAYANAGDSKGWAFDAFSLHGVASGLSVGVHEAQLQYKTQSGSVYLPSVHGGIVPSLSVRLTAQVVASTALTTSGYFPTASETGTSSSWAALPTARTVSFSVSGSSDSVLLLADISPVAHTTSSQNTFFRLIVDGTTDAAYSNTGGANGEYYDAISFHGVVSGLSAGSHSAELQYKTMGATASLPNVIDSGEAYVRITAQTVPSSALATSGDAPTSAAVHSSTSWAALATARSISFTVGSDGEAVLLFADVSRVQHSTTQVNTAFRIIIDGTTDVGYAHTGGASGWS